MSPTQAQQQRQLVIKGKQKKRAATMSTLRSFASISLVSMMLVILLPETSTAYQPQRPHSMHNEHVYGHATIDYSSANDYIQDQYYTSSSSSTSSYFPNNKQDAVIWNARKGIFNPDTASFQPATLQSCGFTMVHDNNDDNTIDWKDLKSIQSTYLPDLERHFHQQFPASKIRHFYFWNPMLRGNEYHQMTRYSNNAKTSSMAVANVAHVDIDFGAYEDAKGVVELIEKNVLLMPYQSCFKKQELIQDLEQGHRFCIINAWKNIDDMPVRRSPLALLATRYRSNAMKGFPDVTPHLKLSRWYIYPELTRNELVLFNQYDRNVQVPSDVWHQALEDLNYEDHDDCYNLLSVRKSFDIRTLIVLEETVPKHRDRFGEDRTRSLSP